MNSPEEIREQRKAIIEEALSWVGTPFLHARNVKNAGADCQSIISQPFGFIFNRIIQIPYYSSQWHLHSGDDGEFRELYIETLFLNNCVEISGGKQIEPYDKTRFVDAPIQPGDIVLAKLGRTYCHGGIVIDWPKIVQAEGKVNGRNSVQVANADANWYMSARVKRFFSWKDWVI